MPPLLSVGYTRKTPNIEVWGYICFSEKTTRNFSDLAITLRKQDFTPVHSAKLSDIPSGFQHSFFSKVPWLSLAFWDSSSLTFPDFSQKWITRFTHLNPMSLKVIQGENLHNFKEILLMMYVYHKDVLWLYTYLDEHSWKHWLT